ncbi:NIPSNAP family protein [Paenibacillus donghaensis]|uniref:NIPSNAP family protein n=1 Tax=Paenibacillus donghaensis TaxID=414771 RepID=A0A2Z2KHW4_9BACL|nr:NIPSNAP family protein [Paenibacillus donghaensis]ASA19381.1 NIPSNAP family protein [Paenibacillus donghaensis]ASA26100.1 NIPSNAP family protein [Paenibacillus donghaensis]
MVTCFLKYVIDPLKIAQFEHYSKLWIDLVNEMGGLHHGYLLPHEGPSNIAYASFSYPSLAAYEEYRNAIPQSPKCQAALDYAVEHQFIVSYERNFFKPLFEGVETAARLF